MIPNYIVEEVKEKQIIEAQVALLNWVIQLTGSGLTNGMIRLACHNKIVELTGEGEKA